MVARNAATLQLAESAVKAIMAYNTANGPIELADITPWQSGVCLGSSDMYPAVGNFPAGACRVSVGGNEDEVRIDATTHDSLNTALASVVHINGGQASIIKTLGGYEDPTYYNMTRGVYYSDRGGDGGIIVFALEGKQQSCGTGYSEQDNDSMTLCQIDLPLAERPIRGFTYPGSS